MKSSFTHKNGVTYKYADVASTLRKMGYTTDARKKSNHATIVRLVNKSILYNKHGFRVRKTAIPGVSAQQRVPGGTLVKLPIGATQFRVRTYGYTYTAGAIKYKIVAMDAKALALDPAGYTKMIMAKYGKGAKQGLIQSNGFDGHVTYSAATFEGYLEKFGGVASTPDTNFTMKFLFY